MCGILGVFSPHGIQRDLSIHEIIAMRDTMTARGPDDAGVWEHQNFVLAHRRLAIRDPQSGSQPWVTEDRRYAMVFNGEIYNDDQLRHELRDRGHAFKTRCDTEVLIEAWAEWGEQSLAKLRGMFAFAVVDTHTNSWWVARDRCGVKPLFYATIGQTFTFASAISALLKHPKCSPQPCFPAIQHYLATLRLTLDDSTLFEGIQTLRPGEFLRGRDLSYESITYWRPPTESRTDASFEEAVDELQHELRTAVGIRLKSDVPVGMMLSGGVDSNTIATFAKEDTGSRIYGCCGGGLESGESDVDPDSDFAHAHECAERLDFDFDTVQLDSENYLESWEELLDEYATPISTPTDAIINQVAKRLKKKVGVALGGEGADEAFCGYSIPHWSGHDFDQAEFIRNSRSRRTSQIRQSLMAQYGRDQFESPADHYLATNGLIPENVQRSLFQAPFWQQAHADRTVENYYNRLFQSVPQKTMAERYAHVLFRLNLESLLARLDSATMAASLEARVPYTDHKVVELAFSLPHDYKISVAPTEPNPWLSSIELFQRGSLQAKKILRAVASRFMPPRAAHRPKVSFSTPLAKWLQTDWNQLIEARITQSPFLQSIFQLSGTAQLAHLPPGLAMWRWPIANLAMWGDKWFGKI